jgi:hypothetical protein
MARYHYPSNLQARERRLHNPKSLPDHRPLAAIIAESITYVTEKLNLLLANQFGRHLGQLTTDTLITTMVFNVWAKGKWWGSSSLTLKVPSKHGPQLAHPQPQEELGSNQDSQLHHCDADRPLHQGMFWQICVGHLSAVKGIDLGCPPLMVLYIFYGADFLV